MVRQIVSSCTRDEISPRPDLYVVEPRRVVSEPPDVLRRQRVFEQQHRAYELRSLWIAQGGLTRHRP